MRSEDLFQLINDIDEQKVKAAEIALVKPRRPLKLRWLVASICLCGILLSAFLIFSHLGPKQPLAPEPEDEFAFLKETYYMPGFFHPAFDTILDTYHLPDDITKIQVTTNEIELVSTITDRSVIEEFCELLSGKQHTNLSTGETELLHSEDSLLYQYIIIIRLENRDPLVLWYYPAHCVLERYETFVLSTEECNTLTDLLSIPFAHVSEE